MKLFFYVVQLPENVWEERTIKSSEEKPNHILHWTTKELDGYFSGEFGWKKMGIYGVCALQYMNKNTVRLIVRATNKESADAMVKSFSWHLDAKKTNKRPYARRCSHTKLMMAGNTIAVKNGMATAG